MSENDQPPAGPCGEFALLMMRRLDGEISAPDAARLDEHLASCPACAKAFAQFEKIASATGQVRMKEPPAEEWDHYWDKVENKIERGVAWTVFAVGLAFVIAYAVVWGSVYVVSSESIPVWAKAGIFIFAAGFALLFVSVAREKLSMRDTDKYRGVKR